MVISGLVIHEEDAWYLQQRLDSFLYRKLLPLGHDHTKFEIHSTELRQGTKEWKAVTRDNRLRILAGAYAALSGYAVCDVALPWSLIGAVMPNNSETCKLKAYELVTKKFDDFVARVSRSSGWKQRGLIIHDRSGVEGTLQEWTNRWRIASSSLGRLGNLADVPMFADSRATRALQAADLIAYGLFKYYSANKDQYVKRLWSHFDTHDGKMHGLFHSTPRFHSCSCPPCLSRHL